MTIKGGFAQVGTWDVSPRRLSLSLRFSTSMFHGLELYLLKLVTVEQTQFLHSFPTNSHPRRKCLAILYVYGCDIYEAVSTIVNSL